MPAAASSPVPHSIGDFLEQAVRLAVGRATDQDLPADTALVRESDRPDLSDYQSNIAMQLARHLRRPPRQIAAQIAEALAEDHAGALTVRVDGPGFINITLEPAFLTARLSRLPAPDRPLPPPEGRAETIVVDYGGPNVAKSMHVGHLRSSVIGSSLIRIARLFGHHVTGDVHLGDWGTQMGLLIEEIRRRWPDAPCFDPASGPPWPEIPPLDIADLEALYPQAAARAREDEAFAAAARRATASLQAGDPGLTALWQRFVALSRRALERDFDRLGVHFDLWWGESTVHDRIPGLIARAEEAGAVVRSAGALVIPVAMADGGGGAEETGDEKIGDGGADANNMPPLILLKSDGAVMYGTTDLATLDARLQDLKADRVLYVVDRRQALHFRQLFRAAARIGLCEPARLEHLGFGTVNGPDGRPFKTRTGGVMRLHDLIELARDRVVARIAEDQRSPLPEETVHRVAIAALKFADLCNYRESDYNFDTERFTRFEGRTGPYLLYTLVRFRAILQRAGKAAAGGPDAALPPSPPQSPEEREIMLLLLRYPDRLRAAWKARAPNIVCDFAFGLAQAANRFYAAHPVLAESDSHRRDALLDLSGRIARCLAAALYALAIDTVDEM